jgi:hypothetical protein
MMDRLLRTARQAVARNRDRNFVSDVLNGPDSTFRSELIEIISRTR